MSDSEIISKMISEPEQGFRLLFDEYHSYVYTIVFNILHGTASRRDIEECVVDVMSDVMINYNTDHGGSLKAYIGSAAKNRAIDISRMLSRRTAGCIAIDDGNVDELPSADNVETKVENSELAGIVLRLIENMESPDSEILIQKFFFNRNSAQIAKVLKMNPITIRSRCSRAVKRLKAALSEMEITF